jgi:predicted RNA-binding protein with PUA-like domain
MYNLPWARENNSRKRGGSRFISQQKFDTGIILPGPKSIEETNVPKSHWLLKTEPTTFSIQHLEKTPGKTTHWEGVRNYQARNFLRDQIKKGDEVFLYHSNTEIPAIVGIAKVVKDGYPDPSQFDPKSKYFDPGATEQIPRWYVVDIQHQKTFNTPLGLQTLKQIPELSKMVLLQKGSRLSVQPVTENEWKTIVTIAKK